MTTTYRFTYAVGDVYRVEISADTLTEARNIFAARFEESAGNIPEATKFEDVTHAVISEVFDY